MTNPGRPTPAVPMPALLRHPLTRIATVALLLVPFFVKIPLVLRRHPVIAPLGDQLHVVLLAGVMLMLYWRGPLTGRLWPAAIAAALTGGAIEFLQILVGRMALLHDFLLDLIGIGLVVAWVGWRGHRRRAGKILFWCLLATIPAQLNHVPGIVAASTRARKIFPVIADFEKGRDRWIWHAWNEADMAIASVPDSPGGPGRVLRLTGVPPEHWPGTGMRRFPHDWSAYGQVVFSARLVAGPADSLSFGLRIEDFDAARNDQFARANFVATRDWQHFEAPLAGWRLEDGSRELNTGDVDMILFYIPYPQEPVVLEFDDIRLQ